MDRGEIRIRQSAWYHQIYLWWLAHGGQVREGYRENLCHYMRVILIWAPLLWFFKTPVWGKIQPWMMAEAIIVTGLVWWANQMWPSWVWAALFAAMIILLLYGLYRLIARIKPDWKEKIILVGSLTILVMALATTAATQGIGEATRSALVVIGVYLILIMLAAAGIITWEWFRCEIPQRLEAWGFNSEAASADRPRAVSFLHLLWQWKNRHLCPFIILPKILPEQVEAN